VHTRAGHHTVCAGVRCCSDTPLLRLYPSVEAGLVQQHQQQQPPGPLWDGHMHVSTVGGEYSTHAERALPTCRHAGGSAARAL
jgi:hypothetical protein